MIIKAEYLGKTVRITDVSGKEYAGKVAELEGPEESTSGEPEIGIHYAGGITMFAESDLKAIELVNE